MQDCLYCYLNLPYLHIDFIATLPGQIVVEELIDLLHLYFPSVIESQYLYDKQQGIILEKKNTLIENGVESGHYLYLI